MLFEKELEHVVQETMASWDIPGLGLGIVQDNEIVYAKGFGVQNLETQTPVTLDSVFSVQSISKCLVATAVMQLVDRGKLDLEAPLVQYLPNFQMNDQRYRQITIRQVLSHTSGMPDMGESEYIELVTHPEYDAGAAERFVRSLNNRKLIADPGERFSYSNIAYNVLGDLLTKVSSTSFENLIQEKVLVPSGMLNSSFLLKDIPTKLLAWPHLRSPDMRVNPIYPYHRADAPSSFLHSTVVDMCHWAITNLNRGSYNGQSILSPQAHDLMWTPAAKRGDPPSIYEQMGLGWTLGHFKSVRTISHGGAGFGWTAFLLVLPEKDSAAVVLCNEESNAHYQVIQIIADVLVGQKPQVKKVSWMVPISRSLAQGGISAAYARYSEIKDSKAHEFYFNDYDLDDLVIQLLMARKLDLAIEVLGLNIHIFPEHLDSYIGLAKLHLRKDENLKAKEVLLNALAVEPGNSTAAELLEKIQ